MQTTNISDMANNWVTTDNPEPLIKNRYCATRDEFQVRLETLLTRLQKKVGDDAYLSTAIVGEIGSNSFDHNLGNWPDIRGIFFAADIDKKIIVLADRGQGIRQTISRVKPEVKNDEEALIIAFTQVLSGRYPERRGNGLKFVAKVVKERGWSLEFYSGSAKLCYRSEQLLPIETVSVKILGCLAILSL